MAPYRHGLAAVVAALVVASAGAARAADLYEDADAYCGFVRGVARSESALLLSPQLFVDYGWLNGSDAATSGTGGVSTLPPAQRLTAGVRYSVGGLWAGIMARQRAGAECERYRATSALARFLVDNREQLSPAALDAKLAVLRGAEGRARELIASARTAVERARATVEELHAAELRLAELESLIADAEAQRAGLPARSSLPPPAELLRRAVAATERVERYEARLRESRAVDLSVRGGYDRVFGVRDELPLFAIVSLTVTPGVLAQPSADAEASAARLRWVRAETEGVAQKVELLAQRLRATLAGEQKRLRDSSLLLGDLESRLRSVESIDSDRLRRVRDAMWFDWVRLRAEHEFLRVHVADLTAALGAEAGP